jgi:peptide/nickel transport system permease protein
MTQVQLAILNSPDKFFRPSEPNILKRVSRLPRQHPIGMMGAVVVALVILVAIFAPYVAPYSPTAQASKRLLEPSAEHLLGTDEIGRDVLSRVIFGARVSLYVGVIAVTIALCLGATTGIISGYVGGTLDNLVMRVVDIMFAFPGLVLAIVIAGLLGPSIGNTMIAIGIVYAPQYARVARGSVLSVKEELYIEAARTVGGSGIHIVWRHILPNIIAPLIVLTTLSMSTAILTEASLSFLGLGTQPPEPSWGSMLSTGRRFMEIAPWVAIYPGLAIMLAVLGFNFLGDGLRDALDPRLKE